MELKEAFAILEIEDGSSFEKVRTVYRRLCIVWHPDRFQDGELKAHAEEKLKSINQAFATIKNAAATDESTVDTVPYAADVRPAMIMAFQFGGDSLMLNFRSALRSEGAS